MTATTAARPPATPARPPAERPWTPVVIDRAPREPWARAGSVINWLVYDTSAPDVAPAGDVWIDRAGDWHAYRRDVNLNSGPAASVGDAMAAVGWLETVRAIDLVDLVRSARFGVPVVLPDGRPGTAYVASALPVPDGSPVTVPPVDATIAIDGPPVPLTRPRPVNAGAVASRPWSLGRPGTPDARRAVRLVLPGGAPVALAPPCTGCTADAGRECDPGCPVDQAPYGSLAR